MSDTTRRADHATQRDYLAAVAPGTGLKPEDAMWVDREMFYAMERELQQLRGAVDRGHALYEAMREITHVGFRSREDMWAFAQEAIDAYVANGGQ